MQQELTLNINREDLLLILRRLQRKNDTVGTKWFEYYGQEITDLFLTSDGDVSIDDPIEHYGWCRIEPLIVDYLLGTYDLDEGGVE